jgi:hypothetical protein
MEITQKTFEEFSTQIELIVNKHELDYTSAADEPDYNHLLINMSFYVDQEDKIDRLIRDIRDNMSSNFPFNYNDTIEGKYPIAVNKSLIRTSDVWSVMVYFSETWELIEDTQH